MTLSEVWAFLRDGRSWLPPKENGRDLPLNWPGLLLRNALFIPLVLAHGFRRLLPPYSHWLTRS